ncbi:MAG: DUF1624 domain-containing protein [Candidatus Lokiarchaeota archaeon]|nr:DUF1624 domain-containing protein [Candidatus Lokiarchaeota archaeon]
MENQEKPANQNRILSIDVFKGFIILLMVFVNTIPFFENIPSWTKHAPDYGLTYVDLIAPAFIFIMALNFNISFAKREQRNSKLNVYLHFLIRNLIIIGIGLFLYLGIDESGILLRWGILQVLGFSGLFLLLVIKLHYIVKLVIGLFFVTIHQFLLSTFIGDIIFDMIEGGIIGSLSWISLIIFSSVICKEFLENRHEKYFLIFGLIFFTIGFVTTFIWGLSRFRITLPFIFLSVGISSLVFYLFYLYFDRLGNKKDSIKKDNFLSIMGKNSLILFIFHFVINSFIYQVSPVDLNMTLAFSIAIIHCFIIWIIAYGMFKLDLFIKI